MSKKISLKDRIKDALKSEPSMFKERDDGEDDVSYLDPDSEDGKKLAEEMGKATKRINELEKDLASRIRVDTNQSKNTPKTNTKVEEPNKTQGRNQVKTQSKETEREIGD